MPLRRNVLFDSFFFSASGSWVPIVDTEPLLFGQAIGHIGIEAVFLIGCLIEWRLQELLVCRLVKEFGVLRAMADFQMRGDTLVQVEFVENLLLE